MNVLVLLAVTFLIPVMIPRCAVGEEDVSEPKRVLVVSSEELVTSAVPIIEGVVMTNEMIRLDFGAREFTDYMGKLLQDDGYLFSNSSDDRKILTDIKQKLCYVAFDFEQEVETASASSTLEKSYELPSGQTVTVGIPRFKCPEAYFQPALLGLSSDSIQTAIYKSIITSDPSIQADLFKNIVLVGNNMNLPGMDTRLQKEIKSLAPSDTNVVVVPANTRKYAFVESTLAKAGLSEQ